LTPETGYFLEKARRLLHDGEVMLEATLYDSAGRTAYLAGFHAAQALIVERTGRSAKTHRGVQAQLHRLAKDEATIDVPLRTLSKLRLFSEIDGRLRNRARGRDIGVYGRFGRQHGKAFRCGYVSIDRELLTSR
jgi:hypothetical protein